MIVAPIKRGYVTVAREAGDKIKDESHLLYQVKKILLERGLDVIKKRMWKDGHMVADYCQYIRSRDWKNKSGFMLWDDQYAIRNLARDFRKDGKVSLYCSFLS